MNGLLRFATATFYGLVGLNESVQRRIHDFQEGHQLERAGGGGGASPLFGQNLLRTA